MWLGPPPPAGRFLNSETKAMFNRDEGDKKDTPIMNMTFLG
jgi:hypothetical protein